MKIRVEDGWAVGYCSKGQRAFATRHGFDWLDYLENGIDEERLLATGDYMAQKLVESAHGREKFSNNRV